MTSTRTSRDLMAEARANEAALMDLIHALTDRLPPAADHARQMASDAAAQAGTTLRAHPVASTLIGAGAAWLAFSALRPRAVAPQPLPDVLGQWADDGGRIMAKMSDLAEDWRAAADDATHRAQTRLHALGDALTARGKGAAAAAREKAAIATDLAQDLAAAFNHGLDDLGEQAAARIRDAREQAYDALSSAKAPARRAVQGAEATIRRHPVATGLLGLAIGAGLAAAFPATRRGLAAVGPAIAPNVAPGVASVAADLMARARALLHEERSLATATATKAVSRAKARVAQAADDVTDDVVALLDDAKAAAKPVARTTTKAIAKTADQAAPRIARAKSAAKDATDRAKKAATAKVTAANGLLPN